MSAPARLAVLAVLGVLAASPAGAESVVQAAQRWGLIGSWRTDCAAPLSINVGQQTFVVRGKQLFLDREFGDRRDSSQVVLATVKPDGMLEVLVRFESLSQNRQFAFTKTGEGRKRAWYNRNVDTDEYTVRDGKFLSNGNPTPVQTRCRR